MKSRLAGPMPALVFAGLILCTALCTAPCVDVRAEVVTLKVAHYLPPNHTMYKELTRWAGELKEKSGGRLKPVIYPSGQLGPVGQQFDLVHAGVADIAFVLPGAVAGRFALTQVAQLPYVFHRAAADGGTEAVSAAEASDILTRLAPELAGEYGGTRILYMLATPAVHLFFSKVEVKQPSDLQGMRVRHISTISADMAKAWGAVPVAVAPTEMADAIQKGVIQGLFLSHEAGQSFQLGSSLRSVAELSLQAAPFTLLMNEDAYNRLPPDLQRLIDETTGVEAARRIGAAFDAADAEGRAYMVRSGVQVATLTTAQKTAFREAVQVVTDQGVAERESRGIPAKAFLDHLRALVAGTGR